MAHTTAKPHRGEVPYINRAFREADQDYIAAWELTRLGVRCEVIALTLVPVKPGDLVRTDRVMR